MMASSRVCIRCLVSGRVQGVFFRAATRNKAVALGLRGRARNLPDGRMEVVACGPQDRLSELQVWLWEGPAHARVSDVVCEVVEEAETFAGFETG
jgi:acylphosphatase